MKKFLITVPCYNEEKNIPLILTRFAKVLTRPDVGLLLLDNGSTDNSASVLKNEVSKYSFAFTMKVKTNQGYGFGVLSGLQYSLSQGAEYIGWTHADMQTDPYDIIRALEILEQSANPEKVYVKGLRKGRPFFDQFFTMGMGLFESVYLQAPLWDINAQPNIFHKGFLNSWEDPPFDFSLDLYALFLAKKAGYQVQRFDVTFPPRIHGTSSWNTGIKAKYKFIKRTIDFSFKLKKRLRAKLL